MWPWVCYSMCKIAHRPDQQMVIGREQLPFSSTCTSAMSFSSCHPWNRRFQQHRSLANQPYAAFMPKLQVALQVPQHQQQVIVRSCLAGEVHSSPETCMLCPAATYSLSPSNTTCDAPCPSNAECHGGAVLVPKEKFWHSAANSTYMAECPNPGACIGDRQELVTCQSDAYAFPSVTGQTQVHIPVHNIASCSCYSFKIP